MSLRDEANQILSMLDDTINAALAGPITEIAKNDIQFRVESDVYPLYTPMLYQRRGRSGGIADTSMYEASVDDATHTLTVRDDRPEVGIVESGTGYTWEESAIYHMQPFPRPYFDLAEEDVVLDGEAETALIDAITRI